MQVMAALSLVMNITILSLYYKSSTSSPPFWIKKICGQHTRENVVRPLSGSQTDDDRGENNKNETDITWIHITQSLDRFILLFCIIFVSIVTLIMLGLFLLHADN